MGNETGLPDYVGDHFAYLVRSSPLGRIGQLIFFGSGVALPVAFGVSFRTLAEGGAPFGLKAMLLALGGIFLASLLWYLGWTTERKEAFRKERPASYNRWFGPRRTGPFGGFSYRNRLRLAFLQIRYLFSSREPSSTETLALTMEFVRHST
ncbi:MAG: hypothetical protein ACRDJ4_14655 [Actinomycetota bacterium]